MKVKVPPFISPCRWWTISFFLLCFVFDASGQNLRCKRVPVGKMVELDTLPVEISSISAQATFQFDEETRIIELNSTSDSVEVCYRVLSSLLTNDFKKRDLSIYDEEGVRPIILESTIPAEKESLFEFVGVEKYGAITRGISFGNRQNVFVNSSLNLQMEGKLDENLNISAVITDQNVPYQPEGNTQQIRDFDNVFIKLYNEDFDVTAGDIVLQQPDDGYFLKYYKNIQGLQASVRGGEKWRYESRVSGAQSKGKFNSAIVEPIDGLSGPYKLRGPNGERFIIVLANSEKVFLDGKKLERGFDQDYVIDYNLGEITFNNHIVITQFSVIRVDYEYAEQFYSRSNFSGYQSVENDKIKLYANFYREKDNPNANLGFVLGEDDLLTLGGIGDDVDQAFITGFDSVQFSENRVLYEKKDTTDLDGNLQTIFMFSSDRSQPLFSPTFSDVGIGNGDYVLRNATSNGRVFEWVSPQGGQSQGRYEPGQFVPLPNKRQLVTLGGEVKLSSFETITTEVAFSNRDDNLFSDIDDGDNTSNAYFFSMESKGRQAFANGYEWVGNLSLEYDQKDFTFIDRYRPILFDRDWNFDLNEAPPSEDLILAAKGGMIRDDDNQLLFSINRRSRSDAIDGWQYGVEFDQLINDFKLSSNHFYLQNDQIARNTRWLRTKTDLSFRRWKVVPGYIFEIDDNRISEADSVVSTLMNFRSNEFYLSSGDSTKSTYRIGYKLRQDRLPQAGKLQDYLFSKNLSASYLIRREKARLSVDFNYRKVEDQLELNQGEDEVINGRINWFQHFFDKQLTHDFSLSTGNSRELRREFIYLPVSTGEGTHTWRDLNADGVQDLNEFFEAINPDERNYVKIFTPTDDYVTSFQTFYLHTIDAYMPRSWRGQGGVRSFLSKVSLNVNFNVNFKTTASNYSSRLNPFSIDLDDTDVISSRDIKRYTFFFNRNGRGFGADFTRQTSDNKQLLVQGFEIREKEEWISNFKVDLSAAYTFRLTTMLGKQLNRSDFLDSRNFEIASGSFKPQLIWQPTNVLRLIGSYERRSKQNDLTESSDESVLSQYYTGELTWNQSTQGSIRASVSYVKIDFTGDPSTYLGYLLLDALQPGSNQTWQVNWQQRISKGMQLSLLYNGRKSPGNAPIHTGTAQVTAYF